MVDFARNAISRGINGSFNSDSTVTLAASAAADRVGSGLDFALELREELGEFAPGLFDLGGFGDAAVIRGATFGFPDHVERVDEDFEGFFRAGLLSNEHNVDNALTVHTN